MDYVAFVSRTMELAAGTKQELAAEECCVCLSRLEEDEYVTRQLPCGHLFHRECIGTWLSSCNRSCPLCRRSVDVKSTSMAAQQQQLTEELVIWFSSFHIPGF
ncbi:unnamed protein product [Musa acuminata var. zebrina]